MTKLMYHYRCTNLLGSNNYAVLFAKLYNETYKDSIAVVVDYNEKEKRKVRTLHQKTLKLFYPDILTQEEIVSRTYTLYNTIINNLLTLTENSSITVS